ncbi:MAG: biotin/lipoyl-binding protein [Polyangia bacterium]
MASPYSPRAVLATLLACFGVLIFGLLLVPWQQSVRGTGRVVAYTPTERQQNIEAPIEGRVVKWHVREGSHVKPGDLIAELSDNDPALQQRLREERDAVRDRLEAARARVTALEGRITALSGSQAAAVQAARARTQVARDRLRAAVQAGAAAEATANTAMLNLTRQQALYEKGLSSTRALELADLEAVRTKTEVDRARAAVSAARGEQAAAQSEQQRVGTDMHALLQDAQAGRAVAMSEIASATAELARMEVRLARQSTQVIRAALTGTILRLVGGLGGEMVKAGDPLAVLIPDTDARAAEVWVDGNDMPLLSEGRTVRLQFEGWPAVQFVGWPSVAVGTFPGRVALIDATDNGKGQFRVIVVPDPAAGPSGSWPSQRYLRQGVRVNGWVLLNRVRLGYELWRQFNGFPPVVAPAEPKTSSEKEQK